MHNDKMSVQAMSNQHTTTMQSLLKFLKFIKVVRYRRVP